MGSELQKETSIPHDGGCIGKIEPTGAETDISMGPKAGMDSGTSLTPMKAGVGELPVSGKSSSVPGVHIDGNTNTGKVGGDGSESSYRKSTTGMTYDYPGL